jgi:hypothetical protein
MSMGSDWDGSGGGSDVSGMMEVLPPVLILLTRKLGRLGRIFLRGVGNGRTGGKGTVMKVEV